MEPRADQQLPRSQALRLHRVLVVFLTTIYLFVGLVHASAHVNEVITQVNGAVPATISLDLGAAATDGSDDADAKRSSALAEQCQVYAPILMPVVAPVAARSIHPARLVFLTPNFLLEDHPRLDTPPPKHLT